MNNYLNNNILLINEYEKMYSDAIDISRIIDKFRNDEFDNYSGFDFGRFRVFIDSALLLFNKEKLNKYKKNNYSYADFFDMVEKDIRLEPYLSHIRSHSLFSDIKKPCIFYSILGKDKKAWDQVAVIRNSFAHMQYGNFSAQESGLMIFFGIYNKDKGIRKELGIVFEQVLHEFVKGYFSNYCFGMPFRSCFFMQYSLRGNRKTLRPRFYIITAKENVDRKYDGYSSNVISELIKQFSVPGIDVVSYIKKNQSKYEIEEYIIGEKINLKNFMSCAKKYQLNSKDKYYYGLKTFLDFETELSNFLIHIGQLNDVLYEYTVLKKCGKYTKEQIEEYRLNYEKRIQELSEDESATLIFKIGFLYLKMLNFALRTEDDDYEKINYSLLDVSKFEYDDEALEKYIEDNTIIDSAVQIYIVERVRNALMHGNVECELTCKGEVLMVFVDSFNKRKDEIKILLSDLEAFLRQDILYVGIPTQTEVLLMKNV